MPGYNWRKRCFVKLDSVVVLWTVALEWRVLSVVDAGTKTCLVQYNSQRIVYSFQIAG